jgi:hypothetical protein
MGYKPFLRSMTDIALAEAPNAALIETARQQFIEITGAGHQSEIMSHMAAIHPGIAIELHNHFAEFLDLVPHPEGGWVASVCINFLVENQSRQAIHRPKLSPDQVQEIEYLFKLRCHVASELIHASEVDVMPWKQWFEYIHSQFTRNPLPLPLKDSGDEPPGGGLLVPYSLLIHFRTDIEGMPDAVDTATLATENVMAVLSRALGGRKLAPLTEAAPAHQAYESLEAGQTQVELMRWDELVVDGLWVIREHQAAGTSKLALSRNRVLKPEATIEFPDTFPWIHFVRWSILQAWIKTHPNVHLEENQQIAQEMEREQEQELAEVPRINYAPDPDNIVTAIIGYTVLTSTGPLLDAQRGVPLTLTSDQAALVSLAVKATTNEQYSVSPFPFIALYMNAAQGYRIVCLREAYLRLQEFCRQHMIGNFRILLPDTHEERWVVIDPEWILPSARREEFNATVGQQVTANAQNWRMREQS